VTRHASSSYSGVHTQSLIRPPPLHLSFPYLTELSIVFSSLMRCLLTASLVVASLAGNVLSHKGDDGPVRRRKSLGFGPEHPHAVFRTGPIQVTNGFMPVHTNDPFVIAELFLQDLLGNQLSASNSYHIRQDSYTDSNTGVTHVYVRQIVNGLEVADGDMNINIKNGQVLSYGNSVGLYYFSELFECP
jgi:extracellular elastinolytic metalloproteinase